MYIKNVDTSGIGDICLSLIKTMYDASLTSVILDGDKLEAFPPSFGTIQE